MNGPTVWREGWEAITHVLQSETIANVHAGKLSGLYGSVDFMHPPKTDFLITHIRVMTRHNATVDGDLTLCIGGREYVIKLPFIACREWFELAPSPLRVMPGNEIDADLFIASGDGRYLVVLLKGLLYRKIEGIKQ
jgi:hypothetical protein